MSLYKNNRIYDVFISSTKRDLDEQRRIAIGEVRVLGHRPIAMEFFGAQERDSRDFIEDCIRQADIFIFILGKNFGTTTGKQAFVAFEYETALRLGKKVLAFVPDDEEIQTAELPAQVLQFRNDLLNANKIRGFFTWDNPEKFRFDVSRSLENFARELEENKSGGWVRSEELDSCVSVESVPSQILASTNMKELVTPLCNMGEVYPNIDSDVDEKTSISRLFWKIIGVSLAAQNGIQRIFIDGGSTTYHFCKEFNKYCGSTGSFYHHQTHKKLTVATNSILNFIELSMNIQGPMRPYRALQLYPAPPISENFGKSFGTLANVSPEAIFAYEQRDWTLRKEAKERLEYAVSEFVEWLDKDGGLSLSVLSAAGLSIAEKHPGPWVKNHASMLLQQGVFKAKRPVALMFDGAKWDKTPTNQEGYRVLFDDIKWEQVLEEQPLAVSFATFIPEKAERIKKYFEDRNFEVIKDKAKEKNALKDLHRIIAFNNGFEPFVVGDDKTI